MKYAYAYAVYNMQLCKWFENQFRTCTSSLSSAGGVEEVDYASLLSVEIEETADMRAQFYLL